MAQSIHLNELRKKKGNIFQGDLTQGLIRAHSLLTWSHAVYFLKAFFFCLSSFKNRRYCLVLFFLNFGLTSNCAEVRVFWFSILVFSDACCWSALCCSVYTQTQTSLLIVCRSRKWSSRTQFAPRSKHNPSMVIRIYRQRQQYSTFNNAQWRNF
jgi:hypothetical protein